MGLKPTCVELQPAYLCSVAARIPKPVPRQARFPHARCCGCPRGACGTTPALFYIPRGGRRAEPYPLRVIAHDVRSFTLGRYDAQLPRKAYGRLSRACGGGRPAYVLTPPLVRWLHHHTAHHQLHGLGLGLTRPAPSPNPSPAPCTLHPAPCTLHPAPCTLHPTLCTRAALCTRGWFARRVPTTSTWLCSIGGSSRLPESCAACIKYWVLSTTSGSTKYSVLSTKY